MLKRNKTKPVRGALPPKQIRRSTSFQSQIDDAKSTERMYSIAVENVMSTTAASLPVEFLIKHKMFKYVQRIAIGKLQTIVNMIRIRVLRHGYSIWSHFCMEKRAVDRGNAASKIIGAARIHIATKQWKKLKLAKLVGEMVAQNLALKGEDDYMAAVIILQSFGRMITMRRHYNTFLPACHRAAYCIQKQVRLFQRLRKGGMLFFQAVQIMQQRVRATATLQRLYRGFLGRMRARLIWTVRHRVGEQSKYETREGIFRLYFEQHGAALRLQRWAWTMGWPLNARIKRRRKIHSKILSAKALKIQKFYRGRLGRKIAKYRRAEKLRQLMDKKKEASAALIQSLIRGFICRQRLKEIALKKKKGVLAYLTRLQKQSSRKDSIFHRRASSKPMREYNRRGGFSFEHLLIGDEKHIRLMGTSARKIQVVWRSYRTKQHLRRVLATRRVIYVRRLIRGFRRLQRRRQLGRVLYRVIPFIRLANRRRKRLNRAACQIQKCFRGFITRRHLRTKFGAVRCISSFLRHMHARRLRREKLSYRRTIYEQNMAGRELFYRTNEYRRLEEFWKGIQRKGTKPNHELKCIFANLAPNGLAESGRLLKLLKGIPDLLDKNFDVKEVEILFAKARKPPEKRLTYPQFLDLLYEMACSKFMGMRPEKKIARITRPASPTSRSREFSSQWLSQQRESLAQQERASAVVNRDRDQDTLDEEVEDAVDDVEFVYGRLTNRAALVVCFIDQYFASTKTYREGVLALQNGSSSNIAIRAVNQALKRLQRFCRNRLLAKQTWKLGLSLQAEFHEYRKNLATVNIQRVYRGWKSRRRAVKLAQLMYVKCVDPDSGHSYWFSSVSEQSFWEKPFLLREFDCGEAVMMPPLEEMCSTACQNDSCARSAALYCNDCDGLLCVPCSHVIHMEGRRTLHHVINLTHCAQCAFQLATRHCKACGDFYCDSCYTWVHRRGRMKLHVGTWVTDRCDICEMRAAWWAKQDPERNYKATVYCRVCFPAVFGTEEEPSEIENVFPVQYSGPAVKEYLLQCRLQEERKNAETKLLGMRKADLVKRRILSATRIQKVFRGHVARKNMATWIALRRDQLLQRQVDEKERNSLLHRFFVAMGMGKALASDKAMEYTMRLFPWYMKATVEDCVGRDWSMAAKLAGWMQDEPPMTTAEGFRSLTRLRAMRTSEKQQKGKLQKKIQLSEAAKQDYIKARATSASYVIIREMKTRAEAAETDVATAKEELLAIENDLAVAHEEWLKYKDGVSGPLKRFIRDKRKNGMSLGILGRVVCGSNTLRIKKADEKRWTARTHMKCYLVLEGSVYQVLSGELFSQPPAKASLLTHTLPGHGAHTHNTAQEQEGDREGEGEGEGLVIDPTMAQGEHTPTAVNADEHADENGREHAFEDEFCVLLDRAWPLESRSDVPLFRLAVKPPHTAVAYQIRRGLQLSYPVQLLVRGAVITLHSMAHVCTNTADMFDEEGRMAGRFRSMAASLERRRDGQLRSCSKPVHLKENTKKPPMSMYGRLNQVASSIRTKVQELHAKRMQRKAVEALPAYYRWEQSTTKMNIECILELDDGTKAKSLGTFDMDPDANCVVMREYIERTFRVKLNESIGEDFCFTKMPAGGDGMLLRVEEAKAWARDYISRKDAPATGEAEEDIGIDFEKEEELLKLPHVVTIIRDRGVIGEGAASMIPEFPPYEFPTATI